MRLPVLATAVLSLLASVLPSSATTIAELVADGATLSGQSVTVSGAVTAPLLNTPSEATFSLQDANGQRVSVFGKGSAPTAGAVVSVTGIVGYKAPDEEFVWPPVLYTATW